ncbi:MAG: RNA polymerase sigma factor [Gemmatimonadetes bacterium]|nr:RNA polymerase sigma factor [Gemmatimonadota bacterium]
MSPLATARSAESEPSEHHLVDRARRGDRAAEYALYHQHAPRVHRLVYRLCGDAELTDDLVQDAFVRAFERLDHFRGDATFGTWIHRIAVNLTLNARRGAQRRARWMVDTEADAPAPPEQGLDPDLQQSFNAAVEQLTEGQREVFVMFALEGYTHVEIGEILGISEGTSKGRLFHARARLKQLLARFAPGT